MPFSLDPPLYPSYNQWRLSGCPVVRFSGSPVFRMSLHLVFPFSTSQEISMSDYLFRGSLADLDPDVYKLTQLEAERQARKIILIASESQAPLAVREAMGSAFQNIYAEGYP